MGTTNIKELRNNLQKRELKRQEQYESLRLRTLEEAEAVIRKYFSTYPGTRVYLTGSITKPGRFAADSDIDIAVDGFPGSRLDLYSDLSELFDLPIDIIIMETCQFAESIHRNGILVCK